MKSSRSLTLPTRPEPLTVDVQDTALLVVDMQNAYCSPGGYLDRCGFDVTGSPPIIAATRALIDACKAAGMVVIYLQNGFEPDLREVGGPDAPVWHKSHALRFMRDNPDWSGKLITKGTWDHEIVEALTPAPSDIVVSKARYSGFAGTGLDQMLTARRIRHLLVAGVATNICVESTIRDAYHREYFPVMVTDATLAVGEGQQEATEYNVMRFFGWLTTVEGVQASLTRNAFRVDP